MLTHLHSSVSVSLSAKPTPTHPAKAKRLSHSNQNGLSGISFLGQITSIIGLSLLVHLFVLLLTLLTFCLNRMLAYFSGILNAIFKIYHQFINNFSAFVISCRLKILM